PLGVAVEGTVAVVGLGPNLGDAAGPRGVRFAPGISRVTVQLPQGVGGDAVDHLVDVRGVRGVVAILEQGHVPPGGGGVGGGGELRVLRRGRLPRVAPVRAAVGVEGTDQGSRVGVVLVEVIDIGQAVRGVRGGGIAGGDGVIVVAGGLGCAGPFHVGAG